MEFVIEREPWAPKGDLSSKPLIHLSVTVCGHPSNEVLRIYEPKMYGISRLYSPEEVDLGLEVLQQTATADISRKLKEDSIEFCQKCTDDLTREKEG